MKSQQKENEVLTGLTSIEAETRLLALRALKNVIIGDKRKKLAFIRLGAVQALVETLSSDTDPAILIQAAAALGSFAASEDGVKAVVEHGGVPQLLRALQSSEARVVEAAVRSLKMVYKSPLAPKADVFQAGAPERLVSLLSAPMSNIPEAAASIIASCCESQEQQDALVAAGAVPPLVALLSRPQQTKQQAGLEALAALAKCNASSAAACLAHEGVVNSVLSFLKHPTPRPRFLACVCLTNLCQQLPGNGGGRSKQEVQAAVLPVLVRLLGEACCTERVDVPSVLCQLVGESAELQRAATDADAIAKLAAFVRDGACPLRRKEGALRALGLLCATAEANRRQLVECRVLPQLAAALAEPWPPLRAAACLCMRSLSRSTNLLRSNLGDVDVAAPLLRLTEEAEQDVTVAWQAAAALANLTVDCSSVKEAVLQQGGVQRFVSLSQSMHQQLRLYGVWGLSSIAFRSTPEVRSAIMQQLPWTSLAVLLEDPELEVREKSVLLLRNLAYNSASRPQAAAAAEASCGGNALQDWSGGELLPAVKRLLERPGVSTALKEHSLYVVVNLASGSEEQKDAVMAGGWPAALLAHMGDADPKVREAAVWAVINLSWSKDGDTTAPGRIAALREAGVEGKLRDLQHDESLPVKERAQTALLQFGAAEESAGAGFHDEEMRLIQDEVAAATAAAAINAARMRMHFRD